MKSNFIVFATILLLMMMQNPVFSQDSIDTIAVQKGYYKSLAGLPIMEDFGNTSANWSDFGNRVDSAYRKRDIQGFLALTTVLYQIEWYTKKESQFITSKDLLEVADKMIEYRTDLIGGHEIEGCIDDLSNAPDTASKEEQFLMFVSCLDEMYGYYEPTDADHERLIDAVFEYYFTISEVYKLHKIGELVHVQQEGRFWEGGSLYWSTQELEEELVFFEEIWLSYVDLLDKSDMVYGYSQSDSYDAYEIEVETEPAPTLEITNGTSGLLYIYLNDEFICRLYKDQKKELTIRPECEHIYAETVAFDKLEKEICARTSTSHLWLIIE